MKKLIIGLMLIPSIILAAEVYVKTTGDSVALMRLQKVNRDNPNYFYPAPAWAKALPDRYLKDDNGVLTERTPAEKAEQDAIYATNIVTQATSMGAFMNIKDRLTASGYDTSGLNQPNDLLGKLPSIIQYVQGLIDAKDVQINADIQAGNYVQALTKMQQRNQLTDGYNLIQSWSIALLMRERAGR